MLTTQDLKPGSQLIAASKARFLELLRLRYSSPLLRLPSAAHIQAQLRHHNTGPDQVGCLSRPFKMGHLRLQRMRLPCGTGVYTSGKL